MLTFADFVAPATTLVNPTDVSIGVRPRQSNAIVRGILIVTPLSVEKFWVVTVPEPLKSIVTEYVLVFTCWILVWPCRRTASERARST